MITKIAFFSHPTRDMAASRRFFGEVLGLKQTANYQDKWCEFDTPDGKSIALDMFSPEGKGPYLALETDDIEAELERLRGLGVPVLLNLMDNKVCKMAIVQDPAGHALMLHQMEPGRLKALQKSKAPAAAKARPKAKPKAKAKARPKPAPKARRTKRAKAKRPAKRR